MDNMELSILVTPASLKNLQMIDDQAVKNAIMKQVRKAVKQEADIQVRALKTLVNNWETEVNFSYKTEETEDQIKITVTTDSEIFSYVDQGTSIRFATMTPDFIPQTRYGSMKSGKKQGGVAYISTNKPRPGISSRRFMETLYNKRRPVFVPKITVIISDGISSYWRSLWH